MPKKYGSVLASSTDPTGQTLSLTIQSTSSALIGLIVWWGTVHAGFDAATAQTQIQAITDLIAQGVPMVFTFWNICTGIWGASRKLFALFKTVPQS